MTGEHTAPLELRVAGRTLTGAAIPYGEAARDRAEMFRQGSVDLLEPVTLNLQHDPERRIASTADGTLRVTDGPDALRLEADLRDGSAELELVRRGALRGLSSEFYAIRETRSAEGLRVIERAAVPAFGLVDRGSYRTTVELRRAESLLQVEARARMGRSMQVSMRLVSRARCECSGELHYATWEDDVIEASLDDVFTAGGRDVIATWADYRTPLASVSKRTLRRAGATGVAIDLPDDDAGRAALAANESAGVVVRPYLDPVESVAAPDPADPETMRYEAMTIRAFVVSSTDAREGWPEPKIIATPDLEGRDRRFPAWL